MMQKDPDAGKTLLQRYCDDAIIISEIASDMGMDAPTVRLLNYVHARCMNGNGEEYFSKPDEKDVQGLAGELGIKGDLMQCIRGVNSRSCLNRDKENMMADIMIEAYANNDRSSTLFLERLSRLKLYTDDAFRKESFGAYLQVAASIPKFRKGAESFGAY